MAVAVTTPETLPAASDALLALAARFRARLADAPDDAALRARVEAWKAEDPAHARAFDEAGQLWALMEAAARSTEEEPETSRPSWRWRGGMAVAAGIGALLMTVPTAGKLIQNWQSDDVAGVGERQEIALADGSRVTLNTDTAMAYDVNETGRSVRLHRGEAYFAVARDPARPFRVQAGDATVTVLGTHFNVRMADDHAVIVDVEEGRVRLEGPAGNVVLTADEQGRYGEGAVSERLGRSADAVAWRRGRAVFYDAPLLDVVADLNRYRRGSIILIGSELRARRITGTFRTDDAEVLPEAIRKTLGARAVALPGGMVFLY